MLSPFDNNLDKTFNMRNNIGTEKLAQYLRILDVLQKTILRIQLPALNDLQPQIQGTHWSFLEFVGMRVHVYTSIHRHMVKQKIEFLKIECKNKKIKLCKDVKFFLIIYFFIYLTSQSQLIFPPLLPVLTLKISPLINSSPYLQKRESLLVNHLTLIII